MSNKEAFHGCDHTDADDMLQDVAHRIHSIYLDLKSGLPKVRALYNLDDVIAELNEMVGEKC